MFVTGFNLFKQWSTKGENLRCFTEFIVDKDIEILVVTWSYYIFRHDEKIMLSGLYPSQSEPAEIKLPLEISQNRKTILFSGNDRHLLMADIASGKIWKCVLYIKPIWNWEQITHDLNTECKTDITPLSNSESKVVSICMSSTMTLCLTQEGNVYNIPEKICTSHCIGKVIEVKCGHEHAILLTDQGCVYTFGNGRRCQLGNGELLISNTPQEVEALAGVNIILVRAGGWHCCALSQSGDLYVWGWNESGQLGVSEIYCPPHKKLKSDEHIPSLAIPTVVEIYERNEPLSLDHHVLDVACGSKHTVLKLKDNSIWASGSNLYGQLGCGSREPSLWNFQRVYEANSKCKIICGPWSTVLMV